jgi:triphosphoribosyl-dephospho-CoA synthase
VSRALLLSPEEVGRAAQVACLLEISTHKPGNVSGLADFRDTRFEDFLLSAMAIGPAMAGAHARPVGETILHAVQETRRVVATNTNLGTILLLSPLARANGLGSLREQVSRVLASLSVEDARLAYEAIRLAGPGGLGRAQDHDVSQEPTVTLREAMASASTRDTIAREYVTDYQVTFEIAFPALQEWRARVPIRQAIAQTFLAVLSRVPDTLIARKNSTEVAEDISRAASDALNAGGVTTPEGRRSFRQLDARLRDKNNRLNPGTTADFVVAALFVTILEEGFRVLASPGKPVERGG